MALTEDLRKEPHPLGENNIAFTNFAGRRARGVVIVDGDGLQQVQPLSVQYPGVYRIDDDASPNYYGFTNSLGAWYILKETISAGNNVYEYLKGSSDIATSWGTRLTDTYDTFENTF
jgi:hypothetical protein